MAPKQKPGRSKQDYATPPEFITAVKSRLGITTFSHDFAADATNTKANTYFDEAYNALGQGGLEWHNYCNAGWGWLNPPFAKIGPWVEACVVCKNHGGNIALLVPAAVGSNWFRDCVDQDARVLFLNGRLAFMPGKPKWLYPKDCMLCLYSNKPGFEPSCDVWNWRV